MYRRGLITSLAIAVAASSMVPMTAEASASFDLRRKVIGVSGIMTVTNVENQVSRGEFARMLVNASSYGSTVSSESNTSVFADVPKDNEYAAYIRIAVEQGWMNGFLGGLFRPEQPVTLQEAAKAVLTLLGYTNEDFTGDQAGARLAKFNYLELNDEVPRAASEVLDKSDCVNLFYNLLKATPKNGSGIYGKILNCELTSDGEINPLTMADNSLKGPKLVRSGRSLSSYVPFALDKANVFLNGESSSVSDVKDVIESESYVLIYYNTGSKTIWAYSESGDSADRAVITGEITNIYYNSTDVMTPSSVLLDTSGESFLLSTSEMQFAFSMYGGLRVGDEVTLVYSRSEKSDGTTTYTVIDYFED